MMYEEIYKCEYCGDTFDDEWECTVHEWNEHRLIFQNDVYFFNANGNPVPVSAESNLDTVFYVVVNSEKDAYVINDLFEEMGNYAPCVPDKNGKMYLDLWYYETADDTWKNALAEEERLENIRKKIGF